MLILSIFENVWCSVYDSLYLSGVIFSFALRFVHKSLISVPCVCVHLLGWEVAGDHIHSGTGRLDNDYLILTLRVPGFK